MSSNVHDHCTTQALMDAGEIVRLRERVAALTTAGTHALDNLADYACVHGRAFDSNEWPDWTNRCAVCAAMRPLAAALALTAEGAS